MTRIHKHTWGPGMSGCLTCGMTRGRAARAAQDRNTILKFLRSAEVGVALHQAKLDPVLYATVMQRLVNVADAFHETAITKAAAKRATTPAAARVVGKSGTLHISPSHGKPKVGTPAVTVGPSGEISVTVEFDEA